HTSYRCTVTSLLSLSFFSFTDPAPTEIYTLSLHDALPISQSSSWWRELSYSGRVGMTDKEGYYQQRYTAANAAYGMSTQDGAILSNTPGGRLFDEGGQEITHILPGDEHRYAIYLPSTYLGMHQIDGKEFNAFFSANTTFFHRLGCSHHTCLAGGD